VISDDSGLPRVTVVIPTRNRLRLLREAIESVERQSLSEWELVVVDDASEDDTPTWLEGQRNPRIRRVRLDEHSERSAARNRGLREARGETVLFLDDDDRLRAGALERLNRVLRRRPEAVAAVGAAVRFDASGQRKRATHPRIGFTRTIWPEVLAGWDSGSGQALFRTDCVREAGGWKDELSYWELGEMWFRVARLGPVAFLPTTVLELRRHLGQSPPDPRAKDPRPDLVGMLSASEREQATRIVHARRLVHDGDGARFRGQHRRALGCYLRAVRTAPLLIRSPLTRRDLVGNMATETARLVVGRHGRRAARRFSTFLRRSR
jgi:glycosyltransferase involved in cell wall biosynthesis